MILSKTNTAVYLYDHLMISAIVLTAAAFIVFSHAKNKKIRSDFPEGKRGMFDLSQIKQQQKGTNCFLYRQSKKIILEPISKRDFIFVTSLELL